MTLRTELNLENLAVTWLREDVAQIVLNMPGKSANIIDPNLQNDLEQAIDFLSECTSVAGAILISGKEKIFVAGADLNAIVETLDWPDEQIHEFCFRGQRLFNRLQELPFLTVAAIHGACVGGGFELALGCHFQIATVDRRTVLGLPETKLGLIPGWAGTVRLPRLIGLEPTIELITSSRLFDAQAAVEMGLIEQAIPPENLLTAAIELIDHPESWQRAAARKTQQHAPVAFELPMAAATRCQRDDLSVCCPGFGEAHDFQCRSWLCRSLRE
jgi:enoyl-CoA hydratase/carnithine racemase